MKVILLKQRRNLGKVGEVVNIKDGFGRNFLLPQGIAMRATQENIAKLEKDKAALEKQNKESQKEAESLAKKVEGKHFTFIKQCGDDGRLFGSVSAKEIAQIISDELKAKICHSSVFMSNPIKSLGIYEVALSLHADVNCQILINVARSESEASSALKEYKNSGKKEDEAEAVQAAPVAESAETPEDSDAA